MKKISTLIFIIIFVFSFSNKIIAADFFTTTAKTQINVNDTFDLHVNINSDGETINSGEGSMSFPADLLSVVSINNSSSIFTMWPEKPVFSNQNGTLSFNGGLPNPGFFGSRGVTLRITFKANKAGVAPISIVSGSIYSNDGTGTDVLKGKRGITMTIKPLPVEKVVEEEKSVIKEEVKPVIDNSSKTKSTNLPPIPDISSRDLPDLNNWSKQKNILLEWDIPKGVDAVQYSIDGNEISIPNILKIPPLNNTELINMANGISNFHIRFRNSAGWGEILHKKIKVDVVNPEIVSVDQAINDKGLISLNVKTNDLYSGIDKVVVSINDKDILESKYELSDVIKFDLPLLKTGENILKVTVYDVAGNYSTKDININQAKPNQPLISIENTDVNLGDQNNITIKSYPNTDLVLFIKNQDQSIDKVSLKTDAAGVAVYDLSNIKSIGIKNVWVSLNNDCEDICVLSEQINITLSEKEMVKFSKAIIHNIKDYSSKSDLLPWIISLLLFILYITSLIKNKKGKNRNIIEELNKAEIDVYKIFKVLKADAKRYKTVLKRNKIELIDKDKQVIENLELDLDEAETYFAKRIEKIENELEL